MRCSKSARSTSRASALSQRFGRGTADDAACGRAGASGAAASATFLSMRVCRRSVASHARLLARSGAAAFGRSTFGRSTSGGAASGRTGASGAAALRVLRTSPGYSPG